MIATPCPPRYNRPRGVNTNVASGVVLISTSTSTHVESDNTGRKSCDRTNRSARCEQSRYLQHGDACECECSASWLLSIRPETRAHEGARVRLLPQQRNARAGLGQPQERVRRRSGTDARADARVGRNRVHLRPPDRQRSLRPDPCRDRGQLVDGAEHIRARWRISGCGTAVDRDEIRAVLVREPVGDDIE